MVFEIVQSIYSKLSYFALMSGFFLCSTLAAASQPATIDDCNGDDFQTSLQAQHHAEPNTKDARAIWLNQRLIKWPGLNASANFRLYYSASSNLHVVEGTHMQGADGVLALEPTSSPLPTALATRFNFVADGIILKLHATDSKKVAQLLQQQLILVQENSLGEVIDSTRIQIAGALDDLYTSAQYIDDFGATVIDRGDSHATQFKLWAPTAQRVSLCLYENGQGGAEQIAAMQRVSATGHWQYTIPKNLTGHYYKYVVDVVVPGIGLVRNRVTDPYSISLTTDSKRSYITQVDAPQTVPNGWRQSRAPQSIRKQTDMTIYELHVRDFSINDQSVSAAHRGKYLAFTELGSNGMQHLATLVKASLTDVHLLPVFDFASVQETGCDHLAINSQDDVVDPVNKTVSTACFNWGYDPFHYNAPEGSYATDPADGATRMLEFRQMVMALHRIGLRVGMDVVYNHTYAAGQQPKSVLDRIVPGYYHRLNALGAIEQSTCCDNTATENRMMSKLMIDSVVSWARNYQIDSFRFDLMAHQPRSVMEALQKKLKSSINHPIQLIGEGWNFGEVADGARFVQASQLSLNGSGIATFNDRLRDAVRGGSASDSGADLVNRKGYINGLADQGNSSAGLLQVADLVRVGLAGSLRDYQLLTYDGQKKSLKEINYNGQPAGYVSQPTEVVNYVENHDNQTLFDINAYKLPTDTTRIDRVRVQMLGAAITAFSQGVAYFHAGIDVLRSKSMDSNSFNSGDWFNRLDWTYQDNYFATGLPPKPDNEKNYPLIKERLENPLIKPTGNEIGMARAMFSDLLKIRASSTLFRLGTAEDIEQRLRFENVGPLQNGSLIVAHLDGKNYPGANYQSILYFINVASTEQTIRLASEKGQAYVLHPVQSNVAAADKRVAKEAAYDALTGQFTIPARSSVVFVVP
ncbi:alpha-1,6-glucosidase domain-containing protein [Solimicrobium silvestre]|uniref:Glycosyl hydrolase family 13 catalytic domain-containing protein n=1 Tax=Solimicrobium silvestre TaxID=2099400 RepID=A0A2S9H5C0_9BURK|nr:alpha-1,6-glucosidase domain-containing protein [Solimicrobium silvestre]PRC95184.1 hypothetical protein S2091_0379 [Solimicrobium silvestre]